MKGEASFACSHSRSLHAQTDALLRLVGGDRRQSVLRVSVRPPSLVDLRLDGLCALVRQTLVRQSVERVQRRKEDDSNLRRELRKENSFVRRRSLVEGDGKVRTLNCCRVSKKSTVAALTSLFVWKRPTARGVRPPRFIGV